MHTILLVEDDLSLIDGLSYSLRKQGFAIDIARTVSEAFCLLNERQYDLLILDISLPDGSGYRIEFVGGASRADLEPIEILHGEDGTHGNHGVTPIIEVRPGANGTITIWYNVTEGYPAGGWVDTGVNIKGAQGDTGATGGTGAQGPKGDDGDDGVSPQIQVVDNGDGTATIQYKTSGDWTDAGDPIPTGNAADKAAILAIVDDAVNVNFVLKRQFADFFFGFVVTLVQNNHKPFDTDQMMKCQPFLDIVLLVANDSGQCKVNTVHTISTSRTALKSTPCNGIPCTDS